MEDRFALKKKELQFLAGEYKKHPGLFVQKTNEEDQALLETLGIRIPWKENLPKGYVKFTPFDFIVEEIGADGTVYTIEKENTVSPSQNLEKAPTYYATLVKCAIQTEEALKDITLQLGCPRDAIQYSGIKDKDAVTSQRISLRGVDQERLKNISSKFFFLKDIQPGKGVLSKGTLKGNRFTIFIRTRGHVADSSGVDAFKGALDLVEKNGIYNFYYLQRFGTPRLVNFHWGYQILKGDYKKAVTDTFTQPTGRELPYLEQTRNKIGLLIPDWAAVLELIRPLPLIFAAESKMAEYLLKNPDDYLGALKQIPEQVTLWIYALSSLLFNEKISSYVGNQKEPPKTLPLLLSNDSHDIEIYKNFLEMIDIYPPPFKNLRPFPNIRLMKREVETRVKVSIHSAEITPHGVALKFDLDKGQYATTFLAHLFTLLNGMPPENIYGGEVSTQEILKQTPSSATFAHFKDVAHTKSENLFDGLLNEV